jgi:predicted transcriptional regulator
VIASEKTSEKIIELMRKDPEISTCSISKTICITQRAVEMQLEEAG